MKKNLHSWVVFCLSEKNKNKNKAGPSVSFKDIFSPLLKPQESCSFYHTFEHLSQHLCQDCGKTFKIQHGCSVNIS